jgi:hypothetical protein
MREIGALKQRGYSNAEIAAKIDFTADYIAAICYLSSFRTYPARLSAGYRGFRSGENESSLGKRPRFPDGAGFSPNASDKRAPGSPPTGRRSLADLLRPIACAGAPAMRALLGAPTNRMYSRRRLYMCVCQLEQGRGEVGVPPRLAPVGKQAPPAPSCSLPGQACPDVREGSLFHADPGFRCMPFDKPRKL